jgi:acyl-CoA reductase-like NAD-dependent aldehyde dehydrogenase
MSDTNEKSGGGFHFGNVGGDVKMKAGGDIVGGDKTTTTTIGKGFEGDEQKQQFQAEIEQLREALRAMKAEIEANASLDQDKKDEVVSEILQQVKALKEVKEETVTVPTGKPAPAEMAAKVEGALDRAGGIVDKLQGLATKGGEVAETVGKFAMKYGPLILSARHLFGLP